MKKPAQVTLQLSSLRSIRMVSMPPLARVSAVHAPEGPPPITATRSFLSSTAPSLIAHTRSTDARSILAAARLLCKKPLPLKLLLKGARDVLGAQGGNRIVQGRTGAELVDAAGIVRMLPSPPAAILTVWNCSMWLSNVFPNAEVIKSI